MSEVVFRPYQAEAIDNFYSALEKGIKRQLFFCCTGSGKTFMTCRLIDDAVKRGERVLVLVERTVLADQWKKSILKYNPDLSVGIEMNVNKSKKKNDVVIASLQTLGRKNSKRIKTFEPDEFKFCVCDEAHYFPTPQGIRVLEYFNMGHESFDPDHKLLLLTATPERADGVSLGYLCDDITMEYTISHAIKDGWLVEPVVHTIKTGTDISSVPKTKNDFNLKQLSQTVNVDGRNGLILKSYIKYLNGIKTLIFTAGVDHAYTLQSIFADHGIRSEVIEANTPKDDRDKWIDEFKSGSLDIILNHNTVSVGFDSTEVRGLMIARPIGSSGLLTQILGRVLRPSITAFVDMFDTPTERKAAIDVSVKPHAIVLDFEDTVKSDKIVTIGSLFGCSPNLNISGKRLFKEVVEPLERLQKDKGVDVSKIENLDEIEVIAEKKKLEISSLRTPPEIESLSSRTWVSAGEDIYEILYGKENKALIVEKDSTKSLLIDREEWVLYEHDTKSGVTKRLQSFYNLSAAIKNADEYAERKEWDTLWKEKKKWMSGGVTESQFNFLMKLYRYKSGYCEFKVLNSRYPDTKVRKLMHRKTKDILDSGLASEYIDRKLGRK